MSVFKTSDVRRVRQAFDVALPPPYEATVDHADGRKTITVRIEDPDHPEICVASCSFPIQEGKMWATRLQPTDDDIKATVARMVEHVRAYRYTPPDNTLELAGLIAALPPPQVKIEEAIPVEPDQVPFARAVPAGD